MTSTPAEDETLSPRPVRRRPWWVLLGIFLGGLVTGVLLVGLLSVGTPDFVAESRQDTASASANPSARVEVAAQARVNAACLRVLNEAQDVYSALSGLDQAVTDVDLSTLDDIVRRLQPVEPLLARDLRACEVVVEPAGGTPGPATASPLVPSPSGSATR